MLQAYALLCSVMRLSSRVHVANSIFSESRYSLKELIKTQIRRIQLILGFIPSDIHIPQFFFQRGANAFLNHVTSPSSFMTASSWIVVSYQVWRAPYARSLKTLPFFFLDFLSEDIRQRSISYAASFGTDEWEGTPEETNVCRKLLQQFKAVSVREHSGVKICREVLGVEAVQMPDPTLLAELADYQSIIDSEKTHQRKEPYIAAYVLDESEKALAALWAVAGQQRLPVQHLMPHATAKHRRDRFPMSVPQWLCYIKECDMVVTDSFHGCVFSIIYNKPFVCLGNEGRGSARFDTLFQTFHLESRLATSPEHAVAVAHEPIDWATVNAIHEHERARGQGFLRKHLS